LLRELLGAEALRELLDIEIIDRVEARLQGRDPERRARHKDGLHDLLRRVGDLSEIELLERFDGDEDTLRDAFDDLAAARRSARVEIAEELRWIGAEDAALYRDALGVAPPANLPGVFLEAQPAPLEQLLMRFARTHAPFSSARIAQRFGLLPAQVEPLLEALAGQGRLVPGEFDPRGQGREWCEPEVLRRIKRGTLNRLRDEISPVEGDVLARFLLDWHGVGVGAGVLGQGGARLDEVIDLIEGLPLSFAELEGSILPARVANYAAPMLDALGAQGQIVWVGQGAIGDKDGRVALYRRERIATLREPLEATPELSSTQAAILEHLEARGASFFSEWVDSMGAEGSESLFAALWELVWLGLVTNDTFAPLRALRSKPAPHRRRGRRAPPTATAGRWSLVAPLLASTPSPTERLHAKTLLYLDRHGVVSRNSMQIEPQPGGFGAVYPMLRELEETGRIRRGHFVEGLSSAQFAAAGAVDRLRALREAPDAPRGVLLAATDPAQPYGSVLDWPPTRRDAGRPRRAVGAAVVLVDGRPCLFIDGGGERVTSFDDATSRVGRARIDAALQAWIAAASRLGSGRIRVEDVDGERARSSALAEAFVRAGFRAGYRGFELDRWAPGSGESAFAAAVEDDALGAYEEGRDHRDG
jgi:ATP-dependent Lhr-like helicase